VPGFVVAGLKNKMPAAVRRGRHRQKVGRRVVSGFHHAAPLGRSIRCVLPDDQDVRFKIGGGKWEKEFFSF
jgi:hypothetical protein